MKSFSAFYLLIMVFYLSTQTIAAASSPSISISHNKAGLLARKQLARELKSLTSDTKSKDEKIEVADGVGKRSNIKAGFDRGGSEGDEDGEGLIYNVDYHGVTTHPSPYPKHPRP